MKPFIIILTLLILTTTGACATAKSKPIAAPASANPDFLATEILGRPTADSITVNVVPAVALELYYEYGLAPGEYTTQTGLQSAGAAVPLETLIRPLQPNTRYYYRLRYRHAGTGDFAGGSEHTFVTQRAPGSTFTFDIQADSHLDANTSPDLYRRTLANTLADRPDFYIDLGDTFMTDKYQPFTGAASQYLAQRLYLGQVGRTAPLFLVLGNHDGEPMARPNEGADSMPAWSAQMRTRYFPNPLPDDFYSGNSAQDQNYYAWEWGDALFIVLDPYRYSPTRRGGADNWKRTLGPAQYQWLQRTLETSRASFKFIFIHQLVGGIDQAGRGGTEAARFFEWGGYNPDGSWGFDQQRPGWSNPIHQLLVENHVTAVFHGHDHLFVKQELDGLVYQTVPQPGAPHADATRLAQEYGYLSGQTADGAGHLRVTVTPAQVTVDFIRANLAANPPAEVGFTYTIFK